MNPWLSARHEHGPGDDIGLSGDDHGIGGDDHGISGEYPSRRDHPFRFER